jgi:hypothetical protein
VVKGAGQAPAVTEMAVEKKPERPGVRIIAHPQNPMVLYITDLASSEERTLFGLPLPPQEGPASKLLVVNLTTGQWREIDVRGEVEKRFAFRERPLLTFEVGGVSSSRVSVKQ